VQPLPFILLLLAIGALLTWVLTGVMRRYALRAELLDQPNERSSHAMPTPRGGGVAICVSFIGLTLAAAAAGNVPASLLWALLGTIPVAVVGWLDDRGHVQARWRFIAHTVAAVWALWVFGGIPPVPILGASFDLGGFGLALCTAYLVWMVNLCNFMDGIDAIAGIEAITVALGGALTWWLATGTPHWYLPVLFAACVAGFLAWNWPPAKIFMGDVGSGFIGIVLAVFSLWAAQEVTQVFWCWFILLGCFMVDATTTLVRRVRRGEKFHQAHRSHAYQYASRRHGSHGVVSLAVAAINLAWLLPIAVLVALRLLDGVAGTLIAYAPLVGLAFGYKAGDRAAQAE
jgi:Fuc2NAc and GlcNAc transferase